MNAKNIIGLLIALLLILGIVWYVADNGEDDMKETTQTEQVDSNGDSSDSDSDETNVTLEITEE